MSHSCLTSLATAIVVCAIGSPVFAQVSTADIDRLRAALLRDVRVTNQDDLTVTGVLRSVESAGLTLIASERTTMVPMATVRRVERRGDSLWNGLIIGALAGAAVIGVPASQNENVGAAALLGFPIGAGIGALAGVGIDALHRGWTTVYGSRGRSRRNR